MSSITGELRLFSLPLVCHLALSFNPDTGESTVNINMPQLMEDELLFSFILRLAEANFVRIYQFAENFIEDRLVSRSAKPKPYILPKGNTIYIPKLASTLGLEPLDFYLKTSIYPGTAPLQNTGKQLRIINIAFRENAFRYPLLTGYVNPDITDLMLCPACYQEDMETHGYSWLRRAHHMPGVTTCWKHGSKLATTKVVHDKWSDHFGFSVYQTEAGDEAEKIYAVFAKGFLDARFDTDRSVLTKILIEELKRENQKPDLIREIRRFGNELREYRLLKWLSDVFLAVESIPVRRDNNLFDKFTSSMNGYELLSVYSTTCVKMKKKENTDCFVTTPWGFIAGWRSSLDDCGDEQEKIAQIVKNVRKGEYEPAGPITSMDKPMKFLHKTCGTITEIRPWDLIENNTSCICMRKTSGGLTQKTSSSELSHSTVVPMEINTSITNNEKLRSYIEKNFKQNNEFDIRSIDIAGMDRYQRKSAANFLVGKHFIKKVPNRTGIFKFINGILETEENEAVNKGFEFRQKVLDVAGNDYVVTGDYINSVTPIEMRHEKCGKTFMVKPKYFLHGVRCSCERGELNREDFLTYVRKQTDGLYEVRPVDNGKNYEIRNTETGWTKVMTKMYIIQELTRPTPSPILPYAGKGSHTESE